jgi:hypothetical protein
MLYQIKLNPAKWVANHHIAPHLSKYPKDCLKGATLANRKLPLKALTKRLVKMPLVSSQACEVKTTQNECGRSSGAALQGVAWSRILLYSRWLTKNIDIVIERVRMERLN